jgi:uncharacterized protein (DUF1778 family)
MATKNKSTKTKRIKDKGILIRVTEAQKKVLAEAAKKEGLGVSSWMLSVALREIERKANAASAAGR